MTEAHEYAEWVLHPDNKIKTGRLTKLAAQRFVSDLKRDDIFFDESESLIMVEFGENHCYQWEGDWRGKPVKFEPWQKFSFMQLYGWIRKDNGRRRFNRFFLEVAKKNGKSTLCAVLALFHLFNDKRIGTPKVFTAANNESQARICVNMAGRIIEQSPDLFEYVEDKEVKLMTYGIHITEVIHREKDGFIRAFSKETEDRKSKTSGGKHGENASLGLVDEFGMAADYGSSGSIETSMASRREWLMAYLTTAGFNKEGPCYTELRDMGIKVLEGVLTIDNYLPIIYELDEPEPLQDGTKQELTIQYLIDHPEVWGQCNPNLGVSVNPDFLKSQLERAQLKGGTIEMECLTLNFNRWVDSPEVFIPADVWNKNTHGIDPVGECYGGIEIADGMGMSCFALYFPGEINCLKCLFWMPGQGVNIVEAGIDQYQKWVEAGFIRIDPGNVVDNDVAFSWIEEFLSGYQMHSFAFPKPKENNSIIQMLVKAGYEANPLSQGVAAIGVVTEEWEKLLLGSKIEHYNSPILSWANSNCNAIRKEVGIRIEKNQRVLPIYACLNALGQAMTIAKDQIEVSTNFTEL